MGISHRGLGFKNQRGLVAVFQVVLIFARCGVVHFVTELRVLSNQVRSNELLLGFSVGKVVGLDPVLDSIHPSGRFRELAL